MVLESDGGRSLDSLGFYPNKQVVAETRYAGQEFAAASNGNPPHSFSSTFCFLSFVVHFVLLTPHLEISLKILPLDEHLEFMSEHVLTMKRDSSLADLKGKIFREFFHVHAPTAQDVQILRVSTKTEESERGEESEKVEERSQMLSNIDFLYFILIYCFQSIGSTKSFEQHAPGDFRTGWRRGRYEGDLEWRGRTRNGGWSGFVCGEKTSRGIWVFFAKTIRNGGMQLSLHPLHHPSTLFHSRFFFFRRVSFYLDSYYCLFL